MNRQIGRGKIKSYTRHEMQDLVVIDGKARGIIARFSYRRNRKTSTRCSYCSGGYGNVFSYRLMRWVVMQLLLENPWSVLLILATHKHPTCIPVSGDHQSKLTLMSESLRNDGRIWVPAK
jgi:succinate dehydrogenase / fumarate reductase flavoprotein subunit